MWELLQTIANRCASIIDTANYIAIRVTPKPAISIRLNGAIMSQTNGPTPIPVTLNFSPNSAYSPGLYNNWFISGVTNYDGDAPTITSSDPTIVTGTIGGYNSVQSEFGPGVLTAQPKAGTATVTVSLDGQPVGIFAVTVQETPLETGNITGGTVVAPQPPAGS